jgi:transposase
MMPAMIRGGLVRREVFAVALPAAFHHNPQLITLYQRLRAPGKEHKVALVACARMLVIFASTVVVCVWDGVAAAGRILNAGRSITVLR